MIFFYGDNKLTTTIRSELDSISLNGVRILMKTAAEGKNRPPTIKRIRCWYSMSSFSSSSSSSSSILFLMRIMSMNRKLK